MVREAFLQTLALYISRDSIISLPINLVLGVLAFALAMSLTIVAVFLGMLGMEEPEGFTPSENMGIEEQVQESPSPLVYGPQPAIRLERVSAYNAVKAQTDDDPFVASCGPNVTNQIAVSRDLFFDDSGHKHLCGAPAVLILDTGERLDVVIYDTMHRRYSRAADILLDDYSEAIDFGVTTGYLIILNNTFEGI